MAQAVFEEHPLGEYLRDAGEIQCIMPGSSSELEMEIDPTFGQIDDNSLDELPEWRPALLLEFLELLHSVMLAHMSSTTDPFVERFKYSIISSSLLAPSLPSPQSTKRSSRPLSIPGRLQHSRESSVTEHPYAHQVPLPSLDLTRGPISWAAGSTILFFALGYPVFTLFSLSTTLYLIYGPAQTTETPKHDMAASFGALEDLVTANSLWESVVQDAVTLLEEEERNSSGSSVPSPIRVALHSCLQTTHSQCDNIRHLFSALTSPTELSQLAEMYAPPSPIKTAFSTEMNARPYSYPSAYLRSPTNASHTPTTPENKRSTWSGSYASLAEAGSPTNSINRRRERHHANISDVFSVSGPSNPMSAPVSPLPNGLPDVQEDEEVKTAPASTLNMQPSHFGAAALDLQRKRRSGAVDLLRSPPPTYLTVDMRSPRARSNTFVSTISSSSKYTAPQPSRHPLSFAALSFSLHGAIAAKRYASSHLLALRFSDEEDEGYWEDVRSVMDLLTTSLVDAGSRLSEALEEVDHQRLLDQGPTPGHSRILFSDMDTEQLVDTPNSDPEESSQAAPRQPLFAEDKSPGFAPMPSHISRFAAHIAAISSALDDAREHLEHCVSALRQDQEPQPLTSTQRKIRHSRSFSRLGMEQEHQDEESKALQAYERLRRELGLALRECERGREKLLEIVHPSLPSPSDDESDDLPALGHDASDESDKVDPTSPQSEAEDSDLGQGAPALVLNSGDGIQVYDDATSHLLMSTTAQHLPLPGIEEVFEAETGPKISFHRERSKVPREERIKLAKAKRESANGLGFQTTLPEVGEEKLEMEKWGPGGDVVQELKDVIWKVGEKRRRMSEEIASSTTMQTRSVNRDSELPYLAEDLDLDSSDDTIMQTPSIEMLQSF